MHHEGLMTLHGPVHVLRDVTGVVPGAEARVLRPSEQTPGVGAPFPPHSAHICFVSPLITWESHFH